MLLCTVSLNKMASIDITHHVHEVKHSHLSYIGVIDHYGTFLDIMEAGIRSTRVLFPEPLAPTIATVSPLFDLWVLSLSTHASAYLKDLPEGGIPRSNTTRARIFWVGNGAIR